MLVSLCTVRRRFSGAGAVASGLRQGSLTNTLPRWPLSCWPVALGTLAVGAPSSAARGSSSALAFSDCSVSNEALSARVGWTVYRNANPVMDRMSAVASKRTRSVANLFTRSASSASSTDHSIPKDRDARLPLSSQHSLPAWKRTTHDEGTCGIGCGSTNTGWMLHTMQKRRGGRGVTPAIRGWSANASTGVEAIRGGIRTARWVEVRRQTQNVDKPHQQTHVVS